MQQGSPIVRTVLGDVAGADLGITLSHEHLILTMGDRFGDPDVKLQDPDVIAAELLDVKPLGLGTVVEVSPMATGRDPLKLRRIAELSGLNVVAAAGYYFGEFLPEHVATSDESQLAERIVAEIEVGLDGTDVRAGVIGEVGNSVGRFTEVERKVFRATGRAQRECGASVITHTDVGRFAVEQLDLLEAGGADLSRVLIGHMDCTADSVAQLAVVERGAFIGFDRVGLLRGVFGPYQTDETRVRAILALLERGYVGQIILSHDFSRQSRLRRNGGPGYGYILREFVPMLRKAGVDEATVRTMLVDNPRRLLSFRPRH